MKKKFTFLIAALMLLTMISQPTRLWGQTRTVGDELAKCIGTGSGYGANRSLTDSHSVSWVVGISQTGYLGANNATNHGNAKPRTQDLPVVKAVKSDATTNTTGCYYFYTTTAVSNVGSVEFYYTGNSGSSNAYAYVVVGDAESASGGDNYTQISLSSTSTSKQGANVGSVGTYTFTFEETQTSARYYGLIIVTSTYKRMTEGTIKLLEGSTGPATYTVTYNAGEGTGDPVVDNNGGSGYTSGTTYIVKANAGTGNPNFTKTGYSFDAWYDNDGLTGTAYGPGDGQTHFFSITDNTNLYAKWNINQYNVAVSSIAEVTLTATYGGSNTIAETNSDDLDYGTTVTLSATGLEAYQAFNWRITKTTGGDDVTEDVLDGTTLTVPDYDITIGGEVVSVYSVTYNCNDASSGCPDPATISNIASGTSITLAAAPTKTGHVFMGWNDGYNTYAAGASYTVTGNKTLSAQWAVGASGEIYFGSADGSTKIEKTSVSANDNLENTWTITTVGTSSFQQNSAYSQIGTNSARGDSITFAMNLGTPPPGYTYQIISFEAKFGGFTNDAGTITLRVGDTKVGTGSLDGTNDVTVNNNINATGSNLKVSVVNEDNLRCKAYYIYYTYAQIALTPRTITFNGHGGTYNSGSTYTQDVYSGIPATLDANRFVRSNYAFNNWSINEDGTGDTFDDGGIITVNANTTLYAQWQAAYTATVGSISNGMVKIVVNDNEYTEKQFVEGAEVNLSCVANAGYRFSAWNVKDADNSDVTVSDNKFTMPAKNVIISATFVPATTYQLVTNLNQIVSGKHYVIANGKNSSASEVTVQAMGAQSGSGSSRSKVDVKVSNNIITENPDIAMCEFVINGTTIVAKDQVDYSVYTIFDPEYSTNGGYLYAASSSNNQLLTEASVDVNNNCRWTIEIETENGTYKATIKARGANTRNYLLNNTNNNIFSCYSGTSAQVDDDVYLYVKSNDTDLEFFSPSAFYGETTISGTVTLTGNTAITIKDGAVVTFTGNLTNTNVDYLIIEDGGQLITSNAVQATVHKTIDGHDGSADAGWKFIASPIAGNTLPTNVGGMINSTTGNYDLYRFTQNPVIVDNDAKHWENYKAHTGDFNLTNGLGYLYANADGADLIYTGTINPGTSSTYTVDLDYTEGTIEEGWNLIGNPFTCNATINKSFYVISGHQANASTGLTTIAPCTGVMVMAEGENETVTFTKAPEAESSTVIRGMGVNLTGEEDAETIDNAIVSFNEGSELPKFYFGTQNANIYIPMNNEEFAIVSSNGQGEMPVNFRAYVAGEYTITVNPEEVEMGYLHLIDNIAGKDVDLLTNPSYSFNARTDDYESRFRLVFSTTMVNAEMGEDFAFMSDGQLVIANEGEATLQVIDVTGRVVATENINGTCSMAINAKAGVYVLRLINGTDVKTQKMVIR